MSNPTVIFDGDYKHKKLYLYTDFKTLMWAKDPSHFRKVTGSKNTPLRVAYKDLVTIPPGYVGTGEHLAFDPIVRLK